VKGTAGLVKQGFEIAESPGASASRSSGGERAMNSGATAAMMR
jgi:hypothetical protein